MNFDCDKLIDMALAGRSNAYTPYSKFKVGASIMLKDGTYITGCNVENSSYGLCICAERNAIGTAVVNGEHKIKAIAIYSPNKDDCPPCGACRQVINEFRSDDGVDVITEFDGHVVSHTIDELLPGGFTL